MHKSLIFIGLMILLMNCKSDEYTDSDDTLASDFQNIVTSKEWVITKYVWASCNGTAYDFAFAPAQGENKLCVYYNEEDYLEPCGSEGDKEIEWLSYQVRFTKVEMDETFTYNLATYENTGSSTQTITETFSSVWSYDPQKKFLQVNFGEILSDHIGRPGFSDIGFHVKAYSTQKIVLELDEDYVTKCPRSLRIELE